MLEFIIVIMVGIAIGARYMRHTPESCPIFNNDIKKKFKEAISNSEENRRKRRIKVLSNFISILSNQIFAIVEAPSQHIFESHLLEEGFAFWNTVEIL